MKKERKEVIKMNRIPEGHKMVKVYIDSSKIEGHIVDSIFQHLGDIKELVKKTVNEELKEQIRMAIYEEVKSQIKDKNEYTTTT